MTFTIRNVQLPQDYAPIASLLNTIFSEQTSAGVLQGEDAKIPAQGRLGKNEHGLLTGYDRFRIVAVDPAGMLVGYGISWRAPWTAPGELNHTLAIHPDHRSCGAGGALYRTLEHWAVGHGASKLNFEVRDDEAEAVSFARRRGFEVERHSFESVLDLTALNPSVLKQGDCSFPIRTLAEIQSPDKERQLYQLYKETSEDIPGASGEFFDFDEWKKWTLDLPGSSPEYVFIAMERDRMIGVAHLLYQEPTHSMYHEFTGVLRQYRGRGIGRALKARSIELAVRRNIRYMRTNNDSLNGAMLAINRDHFGFQAVPGLYKMVKML